MRPTDLIPACVSEINWRDLLEFAKEQTTVGLCWQGMQRLGEIANKPSEDDVMEWMGEYQKITRRNAKIDTSVANLSKFLSENEISYFVFKGQTIAHLYPIPESRTSGDIDFYVFYKDRKKTEEIIGNIIEIKNTMNVRHVEFYIDGIPYEMHYHIATFANNDKQKFWDDMIEDISMYLDNVTINKVKVPVLPPTVYSIYLFTHIYRHFLKDGIALRQFIDWMMFFEAKHDKIVVSELTAKLERLGLLRAFRAFGAILTEVLGMDEKFFPYALTDSDKRYVDKIMTIVIRYGNFGKYGRREQQGGWKHSIETGLRSFRHIVQFFWLSPVENLFWLPKLLRQSVIKNLA